MTTMRAGPAVAIILLAATATPAQQRIQETVTVTAAASPVPFENLARTVVLLTREQIARLPVRTVAELLQYVASVDVRSRGPLGVQSDISIRGATFGQTLVLVDGIRLNNSQTGHHNADIPVVLDDVERLEILQGPGSSLYGADAFGGTVNVVTRRKAPSRQATIGGGQFGLIDGSVSVGVARGSVQQSFGAQATRSSGFMFDRDFRTIGVTAHTVVRDRTRMFAGFLDKAFGANGFYGNSPSREWTNQTLVALEHQTTGRSWNPMARTWYRTHGDHFLWDLARPGFAENFHRTHAVGVSVKAQRKLSDTRTVTIGGEGGGDWIRSNNLGNHAFARGAAFVELQQRVGKTGIVYPGLRYDSYSNFGSAWSPSLAASVWLGSAVKLRSSVGRAFRIPTFTELYYRDPNNDGTPTLAAEHAWAGEGGVDWIVDPGWIVGGTVFVRRDREVIDWIRATARDKWQSTNLRRVTTGGLELSVRRRIGLDGFVEAQYAYLSADAGAVTFLSKYVLDYAPHSFSGFASLRLPAQLSLGQRIDYKQRLDGRHYWVVDSRLGRAVGPVTLFVEGTNLTDTPYQQISGVDMPGRWIRAGLQLREF